MNIDHSDDTSIDVQYLVRNRHIQQCHHLLRDTEVVQCSSIASHNLLSNSIEVEQVLEATHINLASVVPFKASAIRNLAKALVIRNLVMA
jgi:hypothetical protein